MRLKLFDLETLLTMYDDLRNGHFESHSKIKRFGLLVKINHIKRIIDKSIKKGNKLPF